MLSRLVAFRGPSCKNTGAARNRSQYSISLVDSDERGHREAVGTESRQELKRDARENSREVADAEGILTTTNFGLLRASHCRDRSYMT